MAYFPNAFRKVLVGTQFVTTGRTENLTAGQYGFFNSKTWTAVTTGNANVTTNPEVVLALGSYHTIDKIGRNGGYKESVKSTVINPNNIKRFWKVRARNASPQVVQIGYDGVDAATAPQFMCGQTYNFRIDLKGSPALRLLGHNAYRVFSITTDCCANVEAPEVVDAFVVMIELTQQINTDPIFSKLILCDAFDPETGDTYDSMSDYGLLTDPAAIAAAKASLLVTMAPTFTSADSSFSDCSFDPRDYFEKDLLTMVSVQLIDDIGDPCMASKQLGFKELNSGRRAEGTGEQLLRDVILFNNYRQEPFQFNARRRETENMSNFPVVRTAGYDSYYILHNVPRKSNPKGLYNDDLYLLQLSVPENTVMTTFETWMNNYINSVTSGVVLEDLSGVGA